MGGWRIVKRLFLRFFLASGVFEMSGGWRTLSAYVRRQFRPLTSRPHASHTARRSTHRRGMNSEWNWRGAIIWPRCRSTT